jgi:hypothetical protein
LCKVLLLSPTACSTCNTHAGVKCSIYPPRSIAHVLRIKNLSSCFLPYQDLSLFYHDGDELPSFMDILSRARPVVPRVTPPVVDLTIDPSNDLPNPNMESPSVAAVHDAPLATTAPRKSPFRNFDEGLLAPCRSEGVTGP